MNESRQLTPDELDRLEDALEGLVEHDLPDDPSPEVIERLHAYRDVMQLSAEALPSVDVPAGLLDGVMEEARRAAAQPIEQAAAPSLWDRFRRAYLWPSVALAGTMALVLWVLAPGENGTNLDLLGGVAAEPDAAPMAAPADGEAQLEGAAKRRRERPARDDALPEAEPASVPSQAAAPAPKVVEAPAEADDLGGMNQAPKKEAVSTGGGAAPKKKSRSKRSGKASKKGGYPSNQDPFGKDPFGDLGGSKSDAPAAPGGAPQGESADEDVAEEKAKPTSPGDKAGMDQVRRGDAYRAAGNCGLARLQYNKARKSFDRNVQARAIAGLGLCELVEGNDAAGNRQLKQARSLDPSVDAYIRQQTPPPAKKSKKSKKSKN